MKQLVLELHVLVALCFLQEWLLTLFTPKNRYCGVTGCHMLRQFQGLRAAKCALVTSEGNWNGVQHGSRLWSRFRINAVCIIGCIPCCCSSRRVLVIPLGMPLQASFAEEELLTMNTEECLTSMLVRHVVFLQFFLLGKCAIALLAFKSVTLLMTHKCSLTDEAPLAGLALEWPLRLRPMLPLVQQTLCAGGKDLFADRAAIQSLDAIGLGCVIPRVAHGLVKLEHL